MVILLCCQLLDAVCCGYGACSNHVALAGAAAHVSVQDCVLVQ